MSDSKLNPYDPYAENKTKVGEYQRETISAHYYH